jgi:ribonuclease HII
MLYSGIDEAGYGPTLGPLVIVGLVVDGDPAMLTALGAADSKQLHRPGDLAPLERVALAALTWLTGFQPDTAADVFAVLGESAADRASPWMAGADTLRLPLAADSIDAWKPRDLRPVAVHGVLVHPCAYNAAIGSGINKAVLESRHVSGLLTRLHRPEPQHTVVDRLGGRKFYAGMLMEAFGAMPEMLEEEPEISRYRHIDHTIAFQVGGDGVSPCTALASCLAKYARELHMHLLNRWWCARHPWLKPTAGYPEDAKRWLHQIGDGARGAFAPDLVRGWTAGATADPHEV